MSFRARGDYSSLTRAGEKGAPVGARGRLSHRIYVAFKYAVLPRRHGILVVVDYSHYQRGVDFFGVPRRTTAIARDLLVSSHVHDDARCADGRNRELVDSV